MSTRLTANEAISKVHELNGQHVVLEGALSLEFEAMELLHLPKSERLPPADCMDLSSIWIDFDLTALACDAQSLKKFNGRHVLVEGILSAPLPQFGGCGHMSLWPAALRVTAIRKL